MSDDHYVTDSLYIDLQEIRPTCCSHDRYILIVYKCTSCGRMNQIRGPQNCHPDYDSGRLLKMDPHVRGNLSGNTQEYTVDCNECFQANTLMYKAI